MSNRICPACSTGSCKFRDGIICRSWVCSEGIYEGTSGNKGVDKLNSAYQASKSSEGSSCSGVDGIFDILRKFSNGVVR